MALEQVHDTRGIMLNGWTIVFDLDGTLVDTAPDLMGAVDRLFAEKSLPATPHTLLRPLISYGARAILKRALDHHAHPLDEAAFEAWWHRYLQIYADNIAETSRPFAGLLPLLDRLAAQGAALAVCTNKTEALSMKLLGALDLLPRFKAVAGRDTFPRCYKPNPEHLLGAIRMAGGDPARAVMVGDSDVDIDAARNARIPVIAVSFGYTPHPVASYNPDGVIDHYDQFDAALASIRRAHA